MGFWGVGPFENDEALDIKDIWDDYIPTGDSSWDTVKVYDFFKRVYYKGSLPVISDGTSNELIALGQLFDDNQLDVPAELKEKLNIAISFELQKDKLSEWDDLKRKRSNALKKMAKKHNFELDLKSPKKEKSKYIEEIESLNNWFENIDRVNSLLEKMSIKTIDWMEGIKPDFVQTLEDTTWRFEDESDEDNAAKLSRLRYLAVVWFTFFNLKYKPEEISKIINDIKNRS